MHSLDYLWQNVKFIVPENKDYFSIILMYAIHLRNEFIFNHITQAHLLGELTKEYANRLKLV